MRGKTNANIIKHIGSGTLSYIPWGNNTTEPRYNIDLEPTKTVHRGSSYANITKDLLPTFTQRAAFEAQTFSTTSFSDFPSVMYEANQSALLRFNSMKIWYRLYTETARVWLYKEKIDGTLEQIAYYPETPNLNFVNSVELDLSAYKGFKFEVYPFGTSKRGGIEICGVEYN